MSRRKSYNPERRAWKGQSYRKGGERISSLREKEEPLPKLLEERVKEEWDTENPVKKP